MYFDQPVDCPRPVILSVYFQTGMVSHTNLDFSNSFKSFFPPLLRLYGSCFFTIPSAWMVDFARVDNYVALVRSCHMKLFI